MGTVILFVIAFLMIIWGVRNWYVEIRPFIDAVQEIPVQTASDKLLYLFRYVVLLPKAMPFLIDICITLFAVESLGMGAGIVGGITGVFLSNIVSLVILMRTYKTDLGGAIRRTFQSDI